MSPPLIRVTIIMTKVLVGMDNWWCYVSWTSRGNRQELQRRKIDFVPTNGPNPFWKFSSVCSVSLLGYNFIEQSPLRRN